MLCPVCKVEKLSNEFPPETATEECDHPALICLRCTVKHVKSTSTCPHFGCGIKVSPDSDQIEWFEAILSEMFTEYDTTYTPEVDSSMYGAGELTITVLTGESMKVLYNQSQTIMALKQKIQQTLKHDVNKQKLLYNDKEMETYRPGGGLAQLSDYGVKPNSSIYLVVVLYDIPDTFDHVVFDLYWGYPTSGRDYLDATCLIYSGSSFISLCDWSHQWYTSAVNHSGDVMDNRRRKGHHTIHVHLKHLPSSVTHLFFTLSAWRSPNISRYPNPSLKFYEASNPSKNLCKTTFRHAGHSQAVVMCSVSRGADGMWRIFESGKLSAGNARRYDPIKSTLVGLIRQGF